MERADYERLRWRCIRRALLELDITLTRFLDAGFADLSEAEQAAFVDDFALEGFHDGGRAGKHNKARNSTGYARITPSLSGGNQTNDGGYRTRRHHPQHQGER